MHEFNTMRRNIEQMYESTYNTSHESLLSNLERFIKSVNTMAHTVMIPSRLMDLQVDEIAISDKLLETTCTIPQSKIGQDEDNSSISSCDSSSSFECPISSGSYSNNNNTSSTQGSTPTVANLLSSARSSDGSTSTVHGQVNHSNKLDMYTAYKMLVSARNDLVWTSTLEEEESPNFRCNDGENDDLEVHPHTQHILMVKFKHHLDALNHLTAQFADLAERLTSQYELHENMD